MKRFFLVWVLFCCSRVFPSTTFFGPETFIRESGGPTTFARQFNVCRSDGAFTLHLINGDSDGKNRVSSAVLTINGQEIVSASDLNQQVASLERPIPSIALQNAMEIKLTSNPGGKITIEIAGEVACGLSLTITDPIEGSSVPAPWVIIRGTLESATPDVGVVVNGRAAELDLSHQGYGSDPYRWGIRLPVTQGPYSVIAKAKDAMGDESSASTEIVIQEAIQQLELELLPEEGFSPLLIEFSFPDLPAQFTELSIDYEGDGHVDIVMASIPAFGIWHLYQDAGLYFPTVRCRNIEGQWLEAHRTVMAYSFDVLDSFFHSKWNAFRQAIASGEIDAIASFYTSNCWQRHAPAIQAILQAGATQAASEAMKDIRFKTYYSGTAKYLIIHSLNGKQYGNYLYFAKCSDGRWRIDDF